MNYPEILAEIETKRPLIHCVSNIVTANDCANLLLAVGASPIMAQAEEEMRNIVSAAQAVVLNTGTPDEAKFRTCLAAGAAANKCGVPVVLDPVGVGASPWRLSHVRELLSCVRPAVLRVNYGEGCALLDGPAAERGVDSLASSFADRSALAQALAVRYRCTVLLSGTEDLISDGEAVVSVTGGSGRMKRITGAGCMLSALCGAFAAVEKPFTAAVEASRFWKDTASRAERLSDGRGMGSYHMALFDAVSMEQ